MGFFRQEYWSGLPFPSPGDLPNPEMEPTSPVLRPDCLLSELQGKHTQEFSVPKLLPNNTSGDLFCSYMSHVLVAQTTAQDATQFGP